MCRSLITDNCIAAHLWNFKTVLSLLCWSWKWDCLRVYDKYKITPNGGIVYTTICQGVNGPKVNEHLHNCPCQKNNKSQTILIREYKLVWRQCHSYLTQLEPYRSLTSDLSLFIHCWKLWLYAGCKDIHVNHTSFHADIMTSLDR